MGSPAEHYVLVSSETMDTSDATFAETPFELVTDLDGLLILGAADEGDEKRKQSSTGMTFDSGRVANAVDFIECLKSRRADQFQILKSQYIEYGKIVLLLMLKDAGDKEVDYGRLVLRHTVEHFQVLDL
jgi:hypothetical protein